MFTHRETSLTGLFLVGEVAAGMSWPDSCRDTVTMVLVTESLWMTEGLNEQREREDQQEGEAIQNRKHQLWSFSKVLLLTTDNNVSATFDRRKEETINQRFLDRRLPIQYKHPYITDPGGKTRSIFQRVRKCRSSFQCLTPGTWVGNNPSKYVGQDTIVHYGKCTQSKSLNHTWSLLSIPCPSIIVQS